MTEKKRGIEREGRGRRCVERQNHREKEKNRELGKGGGADRQSQRE